MEEYIDKLADRVFKTKDARFMASHRMARSKIASKAAETFLSASIISISLISLQIGDVEMSKAISAMTIILSTFLLVLSLLFSFLDYPKRFENYNNCGLELNRLYHQMECASQKGITLPEVEAFSEEYENILKKYNLNHTTFDFEYSLLFNKNVASSRGRKIMLKVRYYFWDVYLLYWLIAILPIVGIFRYFMFELV